MWINAKPRTITEFTGNPRNPARQIAHDLALRLSGFLVPVTVGGDADPERSFSGYADHVQNLNQMGGGGTSVVYVDGAADIGDAVAATTTDPVRRLFADRLRRGVQL